MRRSRWSRTLVVLLLVASMVALVGAGSALAQPPERVKVLIGFTRQPGPAEQALVHRAGGTIKYTYHLVPAIAATVPEGAIDGLRRNPNVTNVDLDLEVYAIGQDLPWGIDRIDAELVHAGGNKGTGVKVAVIDSGIDCNHPDLIGNCNGGYDFVNDDDDPMDDDGHGTHVAGTIGAADNGFGVVGVAPAASLYALKALEAGSGLYSDIIAALQWAVDNGIQVTNNSYGSSGDPGPTVKDAFDNAYAAGILNVCAAGNGGNRGGGGDNVIYPARYDSCIAVAATDINDNRASFSSTGPSVELAAPGVNILSTVPGGEYEDGWNGTSMASPHVAGTAALVIATGITDANGDGWINDDVRLRLQETAEYLGDPAKYGYGLVDADEAAAPSGPVDDPPVVSITSPVDGATVSGAIDVTADATDDKGVNQVEFFVGSVSIGKDTNGDDGWSVNWVTTTEDDGEYTLTATATDTAEQPASDSINVTVDNVIDPPVASFTYTCSGLTCDFDASGSSDPDGTIASWEWDFGDETEAVYGETVSHTYAGAGIYSVILTVTDDDGATGTDSQDVTVSDVGATMYVRSLDMVLKTAGINTSAQATATVVDADGNLIEGATVSGHWTGATTDSDSGATDAKGQVALESDKVKRAASGTTFTFTVTNVTKEGWTYDSSANKETSDSITVP